jgi:hypothetical protein
VQAKISGNTISNAGTLEASGPRSDLVVSAGSITNAKTVEVLDNAGNFTQAQLSVSGTTFANSGSHQRFRFFAVKKMTGCHEFLAGT